MKWYQGARSVQSHFREHRSPSWTTCCRNWTSAAPTTMKAARKRSPTTGTSSTLWAATTEVNILRLRSAMSRLSNPSPSEAHQGPPDQLFLHRGILLEMRAPTTSSRLQALAQRGPLPGAPATSEDHTHWQVRGIGGEAEGEAEPVWESDGEDNQGRKPTAVLLVVQFFPG